METISKNCIKNRNYFTFRDQNKHFLNSNLIFADGCLCDSSGSSFVYVHQWLYRLQSSQTNSNVLSVQVHTQTEENSGPTPGINKTLLQIIVQILVSNLTAVLSGQTRPKLLVTGRETK